MNGLCAAVLLACLALAPTAAAQGDAQFNAELARGLRAYKDKDYAQAEKVYTAMLAEARAARAEPDRVASLLNNLGTVHLATGRYKQARESHTQAMRLKEAHWGKESATVAVSIHNLADVALAEKKLDEAAQLLERAVAIREKALGPRDPRVAETMEAWAGALCGGGRHGDAAAALERAIPIRQAQEEASEEDLDLVLPLMDRVGACHAHAGDHPATRAALERALRRRERTLGMEDPAIADTLCGLAATYAAEGSWEKARPLLRRALVIRERALGPEAPGVTAVLEQLAESLEKSGRGEEAKPLRERAATLRK
jgi:tetratricopeptide (TPR) repeat protein